MPPFTKKCLQKPSLEYIYICSGISGRAGDVTMSGVRKLMSLIVLQPLYVVVKYGGLREIGFFFHYPRIYFVQSSFYFSCNRLAYLSCKSKQIYKHCKHVSLVYSLFRCFRARVHKTKDRVLKWFTAIMLHNRSHIRNQPFIYFHVQKNIISLLRNVCVYVHLPCIPPSSMICIWCIAHLSGSS